MAGVRPQIRLAGPKTYGLSSIKRRNSKRAIDRKYKAHIATWADPYPWVKGTFPEKLVFAWLADRHVPFTYQAILPDFSGTLTVEEFRPDFFLESFKVILEVQGEYWHSIPAQADKDVYKFAVYEAMGYKVYWFWEADILEDLGTLMMSVNELRGWCGKGEFAIANNIDDLAGLRKVNAGSARPPAFKLSRGGKKRR